MNDNNNTKHQPSEKFLRLLAAVQDGKGQFLAIEMEKDETPMAASKKEGITLRKRTKMVVRTGVEFANLASVKQGIESGERGEVQSLPWGNWFLYPYGIVHNGTEYFRFTLGANTRPSCDYFVNGEQVKREDFIKHLPASKREPSEPSEVISVKLENITRIG